MTQPAEDLTKLPWYGGNKIPASYLRRFNETHSGPHSKDGLPSDLERFLGEIGNV